MHIRQSIIDTSSLEGQRISQLRAAVEKRERGTILASKYHTAPLKIAKAFPMGDALGVIVMDVSPGLLSGDRYELQWKIGHEAHLFLTNQSFTKVHPAPDSMGGSAIRQSFELGRNAIVESMPQPVMLYRDAVLESETVVRLEAGAVWMGAEVLCPGRTLRGERFAYRSYKNRLNVYDGEELIYAQRQVIVPEQQLLSAPGCLAELTHTGVFYAFSDRIKACHAECVRSTLEAIPNRSGHPIQWGVSLTYKHGLAVMAAGTAAWLIQEALAAVWRMLREEMLGLSPISF
ncbi:urease accessory protein UreD [Paenibacillus montanisoli]|uniref:Urease accessory protein UreD n=2 Tax=Paenibacillus montanisoli TaxID=2081970 RepID=A0A328TYU4_9BACL|nr:urease accessory protein UreD [Paenibacillus montanisoli]